MKLKNHIAFDGDYSDDTIWDNEENLITPCGRIVLTPLALALKSRGCECGEFYRRGDYGWSFYVKGEHGEFLLLIQAGDGGATSWLLTTHQPFSWRDINVFNPRSARHSKFLDFLLRVLREDARIRDIRVYSEEEYDALLRDRGPQPPDLGNENNPDASK